MTQTRDSSFYIGRIFDPEQGKATTQAAQYRSDDLTTHGLITGMTGSGKTGMGIVFLEEAALEGIPAIIIDPKGDMTNLLLHFPNFSPSDFAPWLDEETARRQGKDVAQLAEETAALWKNGLAGWDIGAEQVQALSASVDFTVYTPGSSSGVPINILSSFQAPPVSWEENREVLRAEIASTVTALLTLVGITELDPLRSPEHILLSNILENAWSSGHILDMNELILQVQNPPFERLGAFPVNSLYPEKDRRGLAMLLNNFLAAPSFQSWVEGQPLDIPSFLYSPSGKPRHSIFYLAHLDENERMFFVTLLLSTIEAWMHAQRGSSSLRTLIYFDEILGYMPPVMNPPSRPVLLRMLKQARAFGVGLLLATQNPVDVDYKALSNAGTWMIGRLQTDQDKQRLLDGLQNVSGNVDLSHFDRLISGLQKRVFLLHNVHQSGPKLVQSRWAMNYLAGPITRSQIPALNRLVGASVANVSSAPSPASPGSKPASSIEDTSPVKTYPKDAAPAVAAPAVGQSVTRPAVPAGIPELFLQAQAPQGAARPEGILYKPALLAVAQIRYLSRQYRLDTSRQIAVRVDEAGSGFVRWEDYLWSSFNDNLIAIQPMPAAKYAGLPSWLEDTRTLKAWQKDFVDWVYRAGVISIRANEALKVYAGPDVSQGDFREMCTDAARKAFEAEMEKVNLVFEKKLDRLQQKVSRQELEVKEKEQSVSQRRMEELATGGELLFSLFSKRKRSISSSISKRRMSQQASSTLEQERKELDDLERELNALEEEQKRAEQQVKDRWSNLADNIQEIPLTPAKKDIFLEQFALLWLPYYLVNSASGAQEVAAFS